MLHGMTIYRNQISILFFALFFAGERGSDFRISFKHRVIQIAIIRDNCLLVFEIVHCYHRIFLQTDLLYVREENELVFP